MGLKIMNLSLKNMNRFLRKFTIQGLLDSIDTINLNFKNQVIIQRSLI